MEKERCQEPIHLFGFLTPLHSQVIGENNQVIAQADHLFDYDQEGNLNGEYDENEELITRYDHDYRNRLVLVTKYENENAVEWITYSYDAFDRLVKRTVQVPNAWEVDSSFLIYDGEEVVLRFSKTDNPILVEGDVNEDHIANQLDLNVVFGNWLTTGATLA